MKIVFEHQRMFTKSFEYYLAILIIELSRRDLPVSKDDLLTIARLTAKKSKFIVGKNWFSRWLKDHGKLIKLNKVKYISAKRKSITLIENCQRFIKSVKSFQLIHNWNSNVIINCDEIRFNTKRDQINQTYLVERGSSTISISKPSTIQSISALPFVTGSGQLLLMAYIMPANTKKNKVINKTFFHTDHRMTKRGQALNKCYIWTDRGWVTLDAWKKIIQFFIRITKSYFGDRTGILILDRLASHMNMDVVIQLQKANIQSIFLPGKSTHFLQPLDQAPFANFKNKFRKLLTRLDLVPIHNRSPPKELVNLIMDAEEMSFTKQSIIKSFRSTGLIPFSEKVIVELTEKWINKKKSRKLPIIKNDEQNIECVNTIEMCVNKLASMKKNQLPQRRRQARKVTIEKSHVYTTSE